MKSFIKVGKVILEKEGGFNRAIKSAIQHTKNKRKEIIDSVVSIRWKSAPSVREAFIDEYFMQSKRYGKIINDSTRSYNKIWSPGKKYYIKKYGKLRR